MTRMVVFTNGCFDILHRGHVTYLEAARSLGSRLVVGLNSDASVCLLKPGRPINCEADRAYVLSALSAVDEVVVFDELTPVELIRTIHPDVYCKGGDYRMADLDEARLVRSWGGIAVSLPFLAGYSTSSLVARLRSSRDTVAVPNLPTTIPAA